MVLTEVVGPVQTTAEEFVRTQQSPVILDFCFRKTWSGNSHDCDAIVFEKFRFQNVFRPHENVKPSFSNSSVLKSVSEKLRFLDVLVWGVDLTVEIKLCFEISPV